MNNNNYEHILEIIAKSKKNEASEAELQELDAWYDSFKEDEGYTDGMSVSQKEQLSNLLLKRINQQLYAHQVPKYRQLHIYKWLTMTAASIVICLGTGFYFYQKNQITPTEITAKNDIVPGSNKAFLTLANGKRLILTGARNGEIASQAGVKIVKTADGQLVYSISDQADRNNNVKDYNTIETPNGGQYQVILPDGSKVWLNAASSLKYPSTFARLVNRKVELLRGEAYFEVAKDKEHPFVVQTDKQEVKVLGTYFNINAYADEPYTKTTLVEGSVQIAALNLSEGKILKPNQQASLTANGIRIAEIDATEVVLWKNGKFSFNNESMESIMRQVARWYNVEVIYKDPVQQVKVTGSVSRFANISKLLEKLEQTGLVHFKIEGQKLIVSK